MIFTSAQVRIKTDILQLVRAIPAGRVTTFDAIAVRLKVPPRLVATVLAGLTETEREIIGWHRVVASGGAIGRGPHCDQQFAKLLREGVLVSPAGVVQDMTRACVASFDAAMIGHKSAATTTHGPVSPQQAPGPSSRSRGMKDRPS